MAEIVELRRALSEEYMNGAPRRTAKITRNPDIPESACPDDRVLTWKIGKDLFTHALSMYHPRPNLEALMVPDASHAHWDGFLAQVLWPNYHSGIIPVENMSHQPSVFLSGAFRSSQLRWAAIDKEYLAIIGTSGRLDGFVWDGVQIFTDNRNVAILFNPEA